MPRFGGWAPQRARKRSKASDTEAARSAPNAAIAIAVDLPQGACGVRTDDRERDIEPANQAIAQFELKLPARAENVAVVRHALGAFADAQLLPDALLEDVRLAVTEACTNVVVHAYPDDREGPMEIYARLDADVLSVCVRDHGPGIVPRTDSPGLGLGLPLIASLAESVHLSHDADTHTEVRMTFALPAGSNGTRAGAELIG